MSDVKIAGKSVTFDRMVNINKKDVGNALRDPKSDKADNVFFRIGDDHWVGSARKLKSSPIVGSIVDLDGKQGVVTNVDPRYHTQAKVGNLFAGGVIGMMSAVLVAYCGSLTLLGGRLAAIAGAALGALIAYKLGEGRPNVDRLNAYAK